MKYGLASVCVLGGLLIAGSAEYGAPAPAPPAALDKATQAEVRRLQKERCEVLRKALAIHEKLYQAARSTLKEAIETSDRLVAAELDLAATGAERVAVYERCLEKAQGLLEIAKAKHTAGRGTAADVLVAQDACLAAEIGLLKAGGKPKKVKK